MQFFRLVCSACCCLFVGFVLAGCGEDRTPEPDGTPEAALEPLGDTLLANDDDPLSRSAELADVRLLWRLNDEVDLTALAGRVEGQFDDWQALEVPGDPKEHPEWLLHLPSETYPELLNWFETAASEAGIIEVRGEPVDGSDAVFVRVQLVSSEGIRQ